DRHRIQAEKAILLGNGGEELYLLAPARPAAREHICVTHISGDPGVIGKRSGDHGQIAVYRHPRAELIAGDRVNGGELRLHAPTRPAPHNDIDRSCVGAGDSVSAWGADHDRIAIDRNRLADAVNAGAGAEDLRTPTPPASDKDVESACATC